ncbi:MAG TPA: PEP-CTERM sorting domain-containing protein [Candidatus Acidoferrales bacterium]|nr:PEP-CTERM sorting domain-containing protein [Candidatus Acidoferrales bacterium]
MRISRNPAILAAVVCLAALIVTPVALAGSVNMTLNGPNTTIVVSGTYAAAVPTIANFSAPNGDYTITFTLPQNPSSLASFQSFQGGFDVSGDLTFDLNNSVTTTMFSGVTLNFFDTLNGDLGGFAFCLDAACNTEWNLFGGALFNNNDTNPTFLTGPITIDQTLSGYFVGGAGPFPFGVAPSATPEPSSLLLLGTGLVGLFGWGRRKFLA